MSETIDYAEMLEIPVSTLNVTKKRSKKKKEGETELKDRVVESVNERVGAEPESPVTITVCKTSIASKPLQCSQYVLYPVPPQGPV